jgi:hypothetical protein
VNLGPLHNNSDPPPGRRCCWTAQPPGQMWRAAGCKGHPGSEGGGPHHDLKHTQDQQQKEGNEGSRNSRVGARAATHTQAGACPPRWGWDAGALKEALAASCAIRLLPWHEAPAYPTTRLLSWMQYCKQRAHGSRLCRIKLRPCPSAASHCRCSWVVSLLRCLRVSPGAPGISSSRGTTTRRPEGGYAQASVVTAMAWNAKQLLSTAASTRLRPIRHPARAWFLQANQDAACTMPHRALCATLPCYRAQRNISCKVMVKARHCRQCLVLYAGGGWLLASACRGCRLQNQRPTLVGSWEELMHWHVCQAHVPITCHGPMV